MKLLDQSNIFFRAGIVIHACMMLLLMVTPRLGQAAACEKPSQIRVAIVPQGGIHQDIQNLKPLVETLEKELNIPVDVIRSHSYGAVKEGLISGSVHLARLGPSAYVTVKYAAAEVTAFASYTRKADIFNQESAAYYSLLIVRTSSTYADLAALKGRKIALVDPDSTSGAAMPRYMMEQKTNEKLENYFGQILYTGSHENSIKALMNGEIPAAFVSSSHVSDMVESGSIKLSDIKVLWRSAPIPRDPFVLRGQLCEGIKSKISAVFLRHNGQHLKSLLQSMNAVRFIAVKDSDYRMIRLISENRKQ